MSNTMGKLQFDQLVTDRARAIMARDRLSMGAASVAALDELAWELFSHPDRPLPLSGKSYEEGVRDGMLKVGAISMEMRHAIDELLDSDADIGRADVKRLAFVIEDETADPIQRAQASAILRMREAVESFDALAPNLNTSNESGLQS